MADSPDERQEIADRSLLRRPEHAPPHDRFFEDGEEPPDRYDREDELDYIVPKDYEWQGSHWIQIAWRHYRANVWRMFDAGATYVCLMVMFGICSGGFLSIFLEPVFRQYPVGYCMSLMSGNQRRRLIGVPAYRVVRLVASQLPAKFCWLMTPLIWFSCNDQLLSELGEVRTYWLSVAATGLWILIACIVQIRLCGFALELIYDYDLSLFQAFRGSWRLTGPHLTGFIILKMGLSLLVVVCGILTCGIGLLLAVPFSTAVWTAVYLDLAGSAELLDNPVPESEPSIPRVDSR